MKIFENIREKKGRIVKLLGYPLYTDERTPSSREQKFLGGILRTYLSRKNPLTNHAEKSIEFFGKHLMEIIHDDYLIKEYFLGRLVRTIDTREEFKKRYFKYFDDKYDDIYVLDANSGEINLFLTYVATPFIKRNGSKNPLFVATKRYHIDLIQMFTPEIPYVYIKSMSKNTPGHDVTSFDNKRLFVLFPYEHLRGIEDEIMNKPIGEAHYFTDIYKRLNIEPKDLSYNRAGVSKPVRDSMLEKVSNIGLNLENFVFVSPHAYSCYELDCKFWIELCEELKKQGMDVFFNISKADKNIIEADYKTCELTFNEAFALAQMSKQIVCLRSGLSELLLQAGVPLHIIYTKFKNRKVFEEIPTEKAMSGFGLRVLPGVDLENLKEYDSSKVSSDEILENILSYKKSSAN